MDINEALEIVKQYLTDAMAANLQDITLKFQLTRYKEITKIIDCDKNLQNE